MSKKILYLCVDGGHVSAVIDKNIKRNPIETFAGFLDNQDDMNRLVMLLAASGISSGKAIVVVNEPEAVNVLRNYIGGELEFINFPFYDVFDIQSCYGILVNRKQAPFFGDLSDLNKIAIGLKIQTLGFGADFVKDVWGVFLDAVKPAETLDLVG